MIAPAGQVYVDIADATSGTGVPTGAVDVINPATGAVITW